jgi:hypothetical protein
MSRTSRAYLPFCFCTPGRAPLLDGDEKNFSNSITHPTGGRVSWTARVSIVMDDICRNRIAEAKTAMPAFLKRGFETEQGMMREAARFFHVVPDRVYYGA